MATVFGTDTGAVSDIDPTLAKVSGRFGVAQAIARRWITPPGGLFYAPSYGGGLLELLNAASPNLVAKAQVLEQQALDDERIEGCTVAIEFTSETITIDGKLEDADGPFLLTLAVSQLASTGDGSLPAVELFIEEA